MSENAELKAQLAALRKRVEELEGRAKHPAPLDLKGLGVSGPTTTQIALNGLGMSPQVLRDHVAAVPSGVVRDVVGDGGATATLKPIAGATTPRVADLNRSGWRESAPLSNPPGVAQADRLMDAADARDRADLIAGEARRRLMK
jgi:hypothetical protein